MTKITYKRSGVDIEAAGRFKAQIKSLVRGSFRPEVLNDIGGFGSFFRFAHKKFKDPVLVSSADGVGTKLKIAALADKHDTVGIDAVAMNVNDILCAGAEPLFFLDYIAHSDVQPRVLKDVVRGITRGCKQAGCSLIGGETAQMPGMYARGEYDIAGFCVGAVERSRIIDGSRIRKGDVIIGLASNGLHSNGFSLVRKVLSPKELKRYSRELLRPTRIYVKPVLSLLHTTHDSRRTSGASPERSRGTTIKGIAHITGGAFYDKIARILPKNADAVMHKNAWNVPRIFRLIREKGGIPDREMYHTLNMGIGMILVVHPQSAGRNIRFLSARGIKAAAIGEITAGDGSVKIV